MTIFLSFCHAGGAAVQGPSAPSPRRWVLGVRVSTPACLLAAGLSRVLGRRSAPGSGSNYGPGVRQPSSRGRGPDRGALEPPGPRGAEERPRTAEKDDCEEQRRRPCCRPRTPRRSSPLLCQELRAARSMREAVSVRARRQAPRPARGPAVHEACGVGVRLLRPQTAESTAAARGLLRPA